MDILPNTPNILGYSFFPTIGLKVTHACKMNCSFCCDHQKEYFPNYSYTELVKIINILSTAGTKRICFTGGEPLLYPRFRDIVEYTSSLNMETILLSSDGSELNSLSIPKQFITNVRISVHGIHSTHDKLVGVKGAFDKIFNCFNNLHAQEYVIDIATVITHQNINEISDIAQFCIDNGVRRYYIFNLLQSGRGHQFISQNGRINNDLFWDIFHRIKKNFPSLEIVAHPYELNAECIIVEGNGDVLIDPYFNGETFQKNIGNILLNKPANIFKKIIKDTELWNDIVKRTSRSTLIK